MHLFTFDGVGLRCSAQASAGCSEWGLPFLACVTSLQWRLRASAAVALSCTVACAVFLDQDGTHVPCIDR